MQKHTLGKIGLLCLSLFLNMFIFAQELEKPNTDNIRSLIMQLNFSDKNEKLQAINKLGTLGINASIAIPHLINCLKEEDLQIRDATIFALGNIGEPVIPYVIETLNDKHWLIRWSSLGVIWIIGEKALDTAPIVIQKLGDTNPEVRNITFSHILW